MYFLKTDGTHYLQTPRDDNDKCTHKDKYKDKEKRKLPRRKGSCIKAKLLGVAIYLGIHQSLKQFTMSSF